MKTSLLLSLPIVAAFLGAPVHAQVFKCKGPHGVVYQDGPCEVALRSIRVRRAA
jgi:hypothetical protein